MYTTSGIFENITGINDFESNNGTIYVNSTDYNTLFGKAITRPLYT